MAETSFNINDIEQVEGITTEEINRMNEAQKLEVLNDEKTRLREKKNNSESKAKVLLRIYSIVRENDDLFFDQQKFIEKITLSLNRQKPIIQADMAYMTNFVKNISTIYNLENSNALEEGFSFRFVRSGELESTVLKEYSLGNFAKVVKSYLIGKPGEARTNGYATLLKIKRETTVSDNPVLQNSDIFKLQDKPQLFSYEAEEAATRHEILIRDFDKNYKPVNFAMDMHDKLKSSKLLIDLMEKFINNFEDDLTRVEEERHFIRRYSLEPVAINEIKQNLKTFGKYGNLLLIALLINSLNENNDTDYKENEDDEKDIYIKYTNKDFSDWKFQKISLPGSSEEDEKVMNYQDWETKVFEFISLFAIYLTNKEVNEILESNDYKSDNLTSELYLEYGNYRIN